MVPPLVVPYISNYGQVWDDVLLVRFVNDDLPSSWRDLLKQALSPPDCELESIVSAGAMYVRSFCLTNDQEPIANKRARSDATQSPAAPLKWVGASAPSREWMEQVFPELALVGDFRQSRMPKKANVHFALRQQHQDCLYASCPWREGSKPKNASKRRIIDAANRQTFTFLRVHLKPMIYGYPKLQKPIISLPLCPKSCASVIAVVKPPNLPAEPHVSNAAQCVAEEVATFGGDSDNQYHPVHRLDGWVGGIMLVYGKNTVNCKPKCKCSVVLSDKVYTALSKVGGDDDCAAVISALRTLSGCSSGDLPVTVNTYMPPSNLYDRSYPLPSSTTAVDGWKSCTTIFESCRQLSSREFLDNVGHNATLTDDTVAREWYQNVAQAITPDTKLLEWRIRIPTGRRHQIRSVLALLGYPVLFDAQYEPLRGYNGISSVEIERCAELHKAEKSAEQAAVRNFLAQVKAAKDQQESTAASNLDWSSQAIRFTKPPPPSRPDECLLSFMDRAKKIQYPLGLWAQQINLKTDEAERTLGPIPAWWQRGGTFS